MNGLGSRFCETAQSVKTTCRAKSAEICLSPSSARRSKHTQYQTFLKKQGPAETDADKSFKKRIFVAMKETDLTTEIHNQLKALAEPGYRDFSTALQPGASRPLLGVRIPALKQLAAQVVKQGLWQQWLEALDDGTFEEVLLRALLIGRAPVPPDEAFRLLAGYVPYIDNGALCDIACAAFRQGRKAPHMVWSFIQPYFDAPNEYEQRFAVIMALDFLVTETYVQPVLQRLAGLQPTAYYAQMAVAWAVSVCMVKFPQPTLAWLQNYPTDKPEYRMALQKILESRRTPSELRPVILQLREAIKTTRKNQSN